MAQERQVKLKGFMPSKMGCVAFVFMPVFSGILFESVRAGVVGCIIGLFILAASTNALGLYSNKPDDE